MIEDQFTSQSATDLKTYFYGLNLMMNLFLIPYSIE